MRSGPSLAGVRLIIPDHAMGLPVLRALSLCTCCRHYPGAATGRRLRSSHPAVAAFPENVVGSACTSSFSRLARRSLALRPAHSRSHLYVTCYTEGFSHFVSSMTAPVASGWSGCRVGLAPLESAAFSRRTREADTADRGGVCRSWAESTPTEVTSGKTGVRGKALIPSRARSRLYRAGQPATIIDLDPYPAAIDHLYMLAGQLDPLRLHYAADTWPGKSRSRATCPK